MKHGPPEIPRALCQRGFLIPPAALCQRGPDPLAPCGKAGAGSPVPSRRRFQSSPLEKGIEGGLGIEGFRDAIARLILVSSNSFTSRSTTA